MAFIMVYVTCGNEASAQHISQTLIQEQLIACANLFPISSGFRWQGEIVSDNEWVALLKTIPENWEPVSKRVTDLHPYELPAIIRIEAHATPAYEEWIRSEVVSGITDAN